MNNTVEFKNEIANLKPVFLLQNLNSNSNFSKQTNLFINQSLHQIYERNNGFKEKIDFKSVENTIQTPFGKMKYKETKRDRVVDVLNIIFNK